MRSFSESGAAKHYHRIFFIVLEIGQEELSSKTIEFFVCAEKNKVDTSKLLAAIIGVHGSNDDVCYGSGSFFHGCIHAQYAKEPACPEQQKQDVDDAKQDCAWWNNTFDVDAIVLSFVDVSSVGAD